MKRFACLFLSICMILVNMPIVVSASESETPVLSLEIPETVTPGEEIDVMVKLSGASEYNGLEYCLTYDKDKFDIISITEGDEFLFYFPIINTAYSENQTHFSFALSSPCSTNGVVMTAKFRVKSTASGNANFKIENCKMSDTAMKPITVKLDNKQISLKTAQFSVTSDVDEAMSENTITTIVSLVDGSKFSNFEYSVLYDSDKLEVISAVPNSRFSAMAQVNPNAAKNKVFMAFAAGRNFNYSGELLTITFKVKNNVAGTAKLSIEDELLVDEIETNLPVATSGDTIEIKCTHKGVEWDITKEPTPEENGLKEYRCACGFYDSEEIVFAAVDTRLAVLGAQIRIPRNDGEKIQTQGLRFVSIITEELYNKLDKPLYASDTGVGFGTVVFPTKLLSENEKLTKETKSGAYSAVTVPAIRLYQVPENGIITFTACMTDIIADPVTYTTEYTVVPYATYIEDGKEITVYGSQYSSSLFDIAKAAYEDDKSTQLVKEYMYNSILNVVDPETYKTVE